jgi:hypothetical protein
MEEEIVAGEPRDHPRDRVEPGEIGARPEAPRRRQRADERMVGAEHRRERLIGRVRRVSERAVEERVL